MGLRLRATEIEKPRDKKEKCARQRKKKTTPTKTPPSSFFLWPNLFIATPTITRSRVSLFFYSFANFKAAYAYDRIVKNCI